MNKRVSRPLLFLGLSISLVCFSTMFLLNIINYFKHAQDLVASQGLGVALTLAIFYSLFFICGLVFSADSLKFCHLPTQKFEQHKKMIITTFIFSLIGALIEVIPFFIGSEIIAVNILFFVAFVLASIFIMVDTLENKINLENECKIEETIPEKTK